jgi:hypothetical protein
MGTAWMNESVSDSRSSSAKKTVPGSHIDRVRAGKRDHVTAASAKRATVHVSGMLGHQPPHAVAIPPTRATIVAADATVRTVFHAVHSRR